MHKFSLPIDLRRGNLIDPLTNLVVTAIKSLYSIHSISVIEPNYRFFEILKQFPRLTHVNPTYQSLSSNNNVSHHIETTCPRFFVRHAVCRQIN